MTPDEANGLADRIPREAYRRTTAKVGVTNGEPVIHVIDHEAPDGRTRAHTIRSEGEWHLSPSHPLNRRTKRQEAQEAA